MSKQAAHALSELQRVTGVWKAIVRALEKLGADESFLFDVGSSNVGRGLARDIAAVLTGIARVVPRNPEAVILDYEVGDEVRLHMIGQLDSDDTQRLKLADNLACVMAPLSEPRGNTSLIIDSMDPVLQALMEGLSNEAVGAILSGDLFPEHPAVRRSAVMVAHKRGHGELLAQVMQVTTDGDVFDQITRLD